MNENKPLLSICIPTYNRAEYLEKTLKSIIRQPEFNLENVEIIISDNCSSDTTKHLCESISEKYANVKYFCNKENISDRNFSLVLGRASGVFRKLCNDTLIFNDGALGRLLIIAENEKNNKPVIFTTNRNCRDADTVISLESFLYNVSYYITWIGGVCIWGDDWDEFASSEEGCTEKLWQVPFLLRYISSRKKVLIYNQVLFTSQSVDKKDISYGLYKVFYTNYLNYVRKYVDQGLVSTQCFEWLEKDLLYGFFSVWMINYEVNKNDFLYSQTEDLKKSIRDTYNNKSYYDSFCIFYKIKLIKAKIKKFLGI